MSGKLKIDNLHYDLTERDLRYLFTKIAPIRSAEILYDRSDRSRGIAYVTYDDERDARQAIREYDGANAYGQPITLTLMPSAPAAPTRPAAGRSLFDRIDGGNKGGLSGAPLGRKSAPEQIDRYVPGEDRSRSPPRRKGPQTGRRPGEARETNGRRGGRRGGREETTGRQAGGTRSRKTVDQLDAEMADYFNAPGAADGSAAEPSAPAAEATKPAAAAAEADAMDMEMVE